MKRLTLLLVFTFGPLLHLDAQSTDPEFSEKLKSVLALFDKTQEALKTQIAELNESNMALTNANLGLYQDLKAAEKRIETLEAENTRLRQQLSQMAVSDLVSTAVQTTRVAAAPPLEPASPDPEPIPTEPAPIPVGEADPTTPASSAGPENLININTASVEELTTLPLIDEAMAERIISNRPYKNIEDLIINQHFGPMKLRRISPFIILE